MGWRAAVGSGRQTPPSPCDGAGVLRGDEAVKVELVEPQVVDVEQMAASSVLRLRFDE
jgi:hypothetical protein